MKPLHPLAIVIPAYKGDFLRAALASMSAQTDQRFQLYVCDDASPDDLGSIHRAVFSASSDERRFTRFDTNLGGTSLVGQWNRCVSLTQGEPWVWLFSDDDLAEPGCVAAFRHELASGTGPCDVYRFNTTIIDAQGCPIERSRPHPLLESAAGFTRRWLGGEGDCFAVEHIFSRRAFEREGGFVDFPLGWCSDVASWAAFAGSHPICTVEGPQVCWRLSDANISSPSAAGQGAKIDAMFAYADWLEAFLARSPEAGGELPAPVLAALLRRWFDGSLRHYFVSLPWRDSWRVARRVTRRVGGGAGGRLLGMAGWQLRRRVRALRARLTRHTRAT